MKSIFNWGKRITRLFTDYIKLLYTSYVSRMLKWILHQISGRSQLERCILAKKTSSSDKVQLIGLKSLTFFKFFKLNFLFAEKCLANSRLEVLRKIIKTTYLITEVERENYASQIIKHKNMEYM